MKIKESFLDTMGTADGTTKVLPERFAYKKIELEQYTYHENDNLPVIRAIVDNATDVSGEGNNVSCGKPDLLYEMLLLREKLSEKLFDALEKTQYLVNCLSQNQVDMIIKWCQKNGYPYQVEQKQPRKRKLKALANIAEDHYYAQFDLLDFLKDLNEIFCAFKLYQVITDSLSEQDYSTRIMKRQHSSKFTNRELLVFETLIAIEPNDAEKERCKALFFEKYNGRNFAMQLIPDKERMFIIEVQTESLFDAAFYQLALLLDSPKTQIKQCPICKRYFEPARTNQKYCATKDKNGNPTCYAQLYYKRTHPK